MHLDEVLHRLGDWGRYELIFFILLSIAGTWLPAWQIFGVIFVGDSYIDQECKLPANDSQENYQTGNSNGMMAHACVVTETCVVNACVRG